MPVQVRKALPSDMQASSDVVLAAFDDVQGREMADLIADLLEDPSAQPSLSLVVTSDDRVAGHILIRNPHITHPQPMVC